MISKAQLQAVKAKPAKKKVVRKKAQGGDNSGAAPRSTNGPKAKKKAPIRKKSAKGKTVRIDREAFATALIKHSMNATAAYKAVSPKATQATAEANGHRMLREAEVINILTPKLQKLFIDAGIEADYVFKRWVEMSQASPLDYFEVEPNGQLGQLNLNGITDAQRINLKEIKVERSMIEKTDDDGNVEMALINEKINIKVVDQQKAISEIAKHLGLLIDRLADEDVDKIGDLIEQGVARIKRSKDLDGWKSIVFESEADRT